MYSRSVLLTRHYNFYCIVLSESRTWIKARTSFMTTVLATTDQTSITAITASFIKGT